jgi:hypothetical protein
VEENGELEGIKVCRDAPMVSHLLFADDSLILMHADKKNADCLRNLLDRYCQNSSQLLSASKSSIFFSGNTEPDIKLEVCESLNIMTESLNDKYLALPSLVGQIEAIVFAISLIELFRELVDGRRNC